MGEAAKRSKTRGPSGERGTTRRSKIPAFVCLWCDGLSVIIGGIFGMGPFSVDFLFS